MELTIAMKRFALVLAFLLAALHAPVAHAQVVHAATSRNLSLTVGGTYSLFQPDYLGGFTQQSNGMSLRYGLDGVGIFVDAKFSRWVELEGETRWLRWNRNPVTVSYPSTQQVTEVGEDTYLVGPRVRLMRWRGFTPYAKGLVGLGRSSLTPALTETTKYPAGYKGSTSAFAVAFGGGVDYRLNKKFSLRLADFEYQQWRMNIQTSDKEYSPSFHPWGLSAGISYRVF